MPNFGMLPLGGTLLALATQTQSGTSAALSLPPASSYRIIVQVQTVSGTSPTLQLVLATSCDAGTTYNEVLSTATQMTTSGAGAQLLIRPYLGIGDAATTASCSLLGTADLGTNVVNNGPIVPGFIKLRWIISGTLPNIAFQVQYIAIPQDLSD